MKCEYILVNVRKDVMTEAPQTVFPHEVQILFAIHGESNVTITDPDPDFKGRDLDPAAEYQRLVNKYGVDADNGSMSYVELVYGKPFQGGLEKEMALGKSRIVPEGEEDHEDAADLSKVAGLKARIKQIGATVPPAAKKSELQAVLRGELLARLEKAGVDADEGMDLTDLSDLYDEAA